MPVLRRCSPNALADYSTAIRLNPRNVQAWFDRGSWYFNQGRYAPSIADYTQALRLGPRWWLAYYYRGRGEQDLSR